MNVFLQTLLKLVVFVPVYSSASVLATGKWTETLPLAQAGCDLVWERDRLDFRTDEISTEGFWNFGRKLLVGIQLVMASMQVPTAQHIWNIFFFLFFQ